MPRTNYTNRIKAARAQLLDLGSVPQGVLPEPIERSWERCASTGMSADLRPVIEPVEHHALEQIRDKSSRLLIQARPEIENLHAQILGTQSMVILTDATGTILYTLGDPGFISKAERVALQPGVSWREEYTGTNAIGTALVEKSPILVLGAEHYFSQNNFLNCSATPIFDPHGQIIGVLDVSGDYRQPQEHTMALVRMSAQMIENRLFTSEFTQEITLHFHTRPEFIGTLWEGIAVFDAEGQLLAANKSGLFQLGVNIVEYGVRNYSSFFDGSFISMLDLTKRSLPYSAILTTQSGHRLHAKIDHGLVSSRGFIPASVRVPEPIEHKTVVSDTAMLDALDAGDAKVHKAISNVKKVLGREIAILIEGETGTGKELLAKAIHAASRRNKAGFIAINCASIPEGLMEAELFGYEEGAFTGAKRTGAQGKIMKANGGTLFLDEIGEMPLHLQARLLRVLQEREIVPLGSAKGVAVDIAVISATNRKLRDQVEQGLFREDLYYRLNGLLVSLPPLREREDLSALVSRILAEESPVPLALHHDAMRLLQMHPLRGNIRQLRNVLRAAIAFLEDGHIIMRRHFPEDFLEDCLQNTSHFLPKTSRSGNLQQTENDLICAAMQAHEGNVALAAKALGISRATMYRKVKRLGL